MRKVLGQLVGFIVMMCLWTHTPNDCSAAGVTVITHGYSSDANGWVTAMGEAIVNYESFPGTNFTTYKIALTTDGNNNYYYQTLSTNGVSPLVSDSAEIIVELDWSQMAGGVSAPYDISTYDVAAAAAWVLLQTNSVPDLGGHALVEFPVHLIGHSRGGSLMNEISRLLGTNGVWVDHLTTLDPHPLNNDGNFDLFYPTDASASNTYANVLFRDNYWQDFPGGFFDFNGEPVSGGFNRHLVDLSEGYNNTTSIAPMHSNVHLWYHGTINWYTPTTYDDNGDTATIDATMRTNWWVPSEDYGIVAGFYYSRIGGGDRLSTNHPVGPGYPAISDGFNQWWDFGAGVAHNRSALSSNSGQWPNIIKLDVVGPNVVTAGELVSTKFFYQAAGTSSNIVCEIHLDAGFNPYGGKSVIIRKFPLINSSSNSVFIANSSISTSNATPGTYAVYTKISNGTHTRYLYAPELVQVLPAQQPPILDLMALNETRFGIGINAAVGQTIVLQSSTDLQSWMPIATNTLATGRWVYTNNPPVNQTRQFYRAILRL